MGAFLEHIGRRQIDRDPPRRQRQPHGRQCGAHPFARFSDRLIRQPDDIERHHAGRHLHLTVDIKHVDAVKGDGMGARDHAIGDHAISDR
jgi:hypothetical protein